MAQVTVHHALGLHMHQPPGNLRLLIDCAPLSAEQIIRCYERVPRYVRRFPDHSRMHVGFSGTLLEQLREPDIVDRYRRIVDIPAILDSYAQTRNIEVIGMGYYHPPFPLIPPEDWEDHLGRGRQIITEVFGRAPQGFWPSEMAFSAKMVPALVKAGYKYVIVDSTLLRSGDECVDPLRPYRLTVEDVSIIAVPRDQELSHAQAMGLDLPSFMETIQRRAQHLLPAEPPCLITTWSDGENGGWFRQMHEQSGFFGHFFVPLMEHIAAGAIDVEPVCLGDFVTEHPPTLDVELRDPPPLPDGASNLGHWADLTAQQRALEHIHMLSARYHALAAATRGTCSDSQTVAALHDARALILEGESSCFLCWGESWLEKLYDRTRRAEALLDAAESGSITVRS